MYISQKQFFSMGSLVHSQQPATLARPKAHQGLTHDQVHFQGQKENEALQVAVKNGKTEQAKTLVKKVNADINGFDSNGETLLTRAVRRGKLEDIEFLLRDLQANPNQVDQNKWTPLTYAASKNQWKAIPLLHRYQADLDQPNGNKATPLIVAIHKGNDEAVEALLSVGADPYATDGNQQNAITYAAGSGNVKALGLLVKMKKVNINAQDKAGWTPLTIAASHNQQPVICYLHKLGADFTVPQVLGLHADQCAQVKGHTEARDLIWELQNSSTKKKLDLIVEEDSIDDELFKRLEALKRPGNNKSSNSGSLTFIGVDPVPGIYPDKQALKSAQWKKRLDLLKLGLFFTTAATAITVGLVFPPALPAVAGGAALLDPTVQKVISSSLSGSLNAIGGLMGNREAFPQAKKKTLDALAKFTTQLKKGIDPLRNKPRFKAHVKFFDRLSTIFEQFATTIQEKTTYEDCLIPYMEFEEKLHAALGDFLKEQGEMQKAASNSKDKKAATENILEVQEFLRKYAKYMTAANKEIAKDGRISEPTKLNFEELEKIKKQSQVPLLAEWAKSENTIAYALARLRTVQVNTDSDVFAPIAEKC